MDTNVKKKKKKKNLFVSQAALAPWNRSYRYMHISILKFFYAGCDVKRADSPYIVDYCMTTVLICFLLNKN